MAHETFDQLSVPRSIRFDSANMATLRRKPSAATGTMSHDRAAIQSLRDCTSRGATAIVTAESSSCGRNSQATTPQCACDAPTEKRTARELNHRVLVPPRRGAHLGVNEICLSSRRMVSVDPPAASVRIGAPRRREALSEDRIQRSRNDSPRCTRHFCAARHQEQLRTGSVVDESALESHGEAGRCLDGAVPSSRMMERRGCTDMSASHIRRRGRVGGRKNV
jgi:hypothetical protein